jgi:hypothetical protein
MGELSQGTIRLNEETCKLTDSREILARNNTANTNMNNKKNHFLKNNR